METIGNEEHWIIISKYLTAEELTDDETKTFTKLFREKNNGELMDSLIKIFNSSPLSGLDAENSLIRLTKRIKNDAA